MFLLISTHFTATLGIPLSSLVLKFGSIARTSPVEPGDLTNRLAEPPTRSLRPVIPNNACPPRITAAAGTELAGAYFGGTVKPKLSSHLTELYTPKGFIAHAAWLDQACAHCPIFPTAASRRSLDRVSVPVWPITLSGRLPIVALVGIYPTN